MNRLIFVITSFHLFFLASHRLYARPVLAFGDLRGHLEPCGCDPRTDVGGIRRLSAAIDRYRRLTPNLLVLNSGNSLSSAQSDSAEVSGIIESLEEIKPSATLVNEMELKRLQNKRILPNISWVLSNLRRKSKDDFIKNVIQFGDVEIFGYLGIKNPDLQAFDRTLLDRWKRQSKVKSSFQRVLIFSGSDADLSKIATAGFFDVIVSSNPTKIGVEIGDAEQKNENALIRSKSGSSLIWAVPFGGGGLLRAGGLERTTFPLTLEASLKSGESLKTPPPTIDVLIPHVEFIHWLRQGEENGASPAILAVFDKVRLAGRNEFKMLSEARVKDLESSEYVGAEACAACHKSSYDIWMKSKHAGAMLTLINKSRHEDPTCVECHVVGFIAKGGYVSEEKSPQLSNVQCENCHGPRRQHVANPLFHPKVDAKTVCAECHTPPHSPGFEQNKYWEMIKHK